MSGFGRWVTHAGLVAALAACASTPTPTTAPPAPTATLPAPTATPMPTSTAVPREPFRIVGYATDGETIVDQIQFDKLTHVNYAFLTPRADGSLNALLNPWKLEDVVRRAHAAGGRVLISVGGWGWDEAFEALAADDVARGRFVDALLAFATEYELDGIDIDWEYPDVGESSRHYLELMRALRAGLPERGLLTAAVAAAGDLAEGIPTEVFGIVDFLNVMAYDGSATDHSPLSYAADALAYWAARGLAPEQTVLGVPFYSRPGEKTYRQLVATDPAAAQVDTWTLNGTAEYYNGIPTMQRKTELARERASGIMIWALHHDTADATSLLGAIFAASR